MSNPSDISDHFILECLIAGVSSAPVRTEDEKLPKAEVIRVLRAAQAKLGEKDTPATTADEQRTALDKSLQEIEARALGRQVLRNIARLTELNNSLVESCRGDFPRRQKEQMLNVMGVSVNVVDELQALAKSLGDHTLAKATAELEASTD